jgi:hypothetical protein
MGAGAWKEVPPELRTRTQPREAGLRVSSRTPPAAWIDTRWGSSLQKGGCDPLYRLEDSRTPLPRTAAQAAAVSRLRACARCDQAIAGPAVHRRDFADVAEVLAETQLCWRCYATLYTELDDGRRAEAAARWLKRREHVAVLDLETTGLEDARIIEVGVVLAGSHPATRKAGGPKRRRRRPRPPRGGRSRAALCRCLSPGRRGGQPRAG